MRIIAADDEVHLGHEHVPDTKIRLQLCSDLAAVEQIWREFQRDADCTVFQLFDWLSEWIRHVGQRRSAKPLIVLGFDASGQLLIILPLAIEGGRLLRRLTWLGSDVCDYNAPLLAENFSERVTPQQFARLWRDTVALMSANPLFQFDMIDMDKMPEIVGRQLNPFLHLSALRRNYSGHVARLGDNWERYYASKRSAQTRSRQRNKLKQLSKYGNTAFVEVLDPNGVRHTMDVLIEQKRKYCARNGYDDLFDRAEYREFFHAVTSNPKLRDVIHLSRLDVGATHAAIALGLRHNTHYYLLMSGYHEGPLSRLGPGGAHLLRLLDYAIGQKLERFDFTIGDESYKREWTDIEVGIFAYLETTTLVGSPAVAIKNAMHRIAFLVHGKPALQHPLRKIRAAALALRRYRMRRAH